MDTDAVLAPAPGARRSSTSWPTPTPPARRHEKRWQDVDELLAAGIDVISTVNIQHLESLNDVVERITGIRQRETDPRPRRAGRRPDRARRHGARGAAPPAGPRQRLRAATRSTPRSATTSAPGNLSALRELALLWVADQVDDSLQDYRERHGITRPWETRERSRRRPRRRARHRPPRAAGGADGAQRAKGDLIGVHVVADSGLSAGAGEPDAAAVAAQRQPARGARRRVPPGRRATTSPPPSSIWPDPRTPPRSCSAPADDRAGSELLSGSVINRVVRRSGSDRRARHLPPAGDDDGTRPAAPRRCARSSPRCRRAASCGAGCSSPSACR